MHLSSHQKSKESSEEKYFTLPHGAHPSSHSGSKSSLEEKYFTLPHTSHQKSKGSLEGVGEGSSPKVMLEEKYFTLPRKLFSPYQRQRIPFDEAGKGSPSPRQRDWRLFGVDEDPRKSDQEVPGPSGADESKPHKPEDPEAKTSGEANIKQQLSGLIKGLNQARTKNLQKVNKGMEEAIKKMQKDWTTGKDKVTDALGIRNRQREMEKHYQHQQQLRYQQQQQQRYQQQQHQLQLRRQQQLQQQRQQLQQQQQQQQRYQQQQQQQHYQQQQQQRYQPVQRYQPIQHQQHHQQHHVLAHHKFHHPLPKRIEKMYRFTDYSTEYGDDNENYAPGYFRLPGVDYPDQDDENNEGLNDYEGSYRRMSNRGKKRISNWITSGSPLHETVESLPEVQREESRNREMANTEYSNPLKSNSDGSGGSGGQKASGSSDEDTHSAFTEAKTYTGAMVMPKPRKSVPFSAKKGATGTIKTVVNTQKVVSKLFEKAFFEEQKIEGLREQAAMAEKKVNYLIDKANTYGKEVVMGELTIALQLYEEARQAYEKPAALVQELKAQAYEYLREQSRQGVDPKNVHPSVHDRHERK
ncbi:hypothetical protein RTP6_005931 [Batrachochytrium dendrobatidis]